MQGVNSTCSSGWVSYGGFCIPCSSNKYANSDQCLRCSVGSYSQEVSTNCTLAPDGLTIPKSEVQTLSSSHVSRSVRFCVNVRVSGNFAVCGGDDSIHIFENKNGTWVEHQYLIPSDGKTTTWNSNEYSKNFGVSVAISCDVIVVGANMDYSKDVAAGSAYIFERDKSTNTWSQKAKIFGSDTTGGDYYGSFVDVSGHVIIVGAPQKSTMAGAAYIYERDSVLWSQKAKWVSTEAYSFFGSVAVDGIWAVIGAPCHSFVAKPGSIHLYKRSTAGAWTEAAKFTASNAENGDDFGKHVAISGDTVVATSSKDGGMAIVFDYNGVWNETARLSAAFGESVDHFQNNVDINGDTIVIGAYRDDTQGIDAGAAFVYGRNIATRQWLINAKLVASDGKPNIWLGRGVGTSGSYVFLGSNYVVSGNDTVASAYVYGCPGGSYKDNDACVLCPVNTYSSIAGNGPSSCIDCPFQSPLNVPGSKSCVNCNAGDYLDQVLNQCTGCPKGSYSNITGINSVTQCSQFSVGSYTSITGSTQCTACSAGTYSALIGSSACTQCTAGLYSSLLGASACTACPTGHYCSGSGSKQPVSCPSGETTDSLGSPSCYTCPFPSQCLGAGVCLPNHKPPMCGKCVSKYYMKGTQCKQCPTTPTLLIVALVIAALILIIVVIVRIPPNWLFALRLLSGFIQSYTLSLAVAVPWPDFIMWLRRVLSLFYFDIELASPECIFDNFDWYYRYWTVIIAASCIPVLLVIIVLVISILRKALLIAKSKWSLYLALTKLHVRISRTIFTVFTLAFVPVTKMAATAFVCVKSGPTTSVLRDDTSVRCTTSEHVSIQVISAFILVIFSLLGPLFLAISTLYDVYIRDNGDVTKDSVFLVDRVSRSFRNREFVQCVGWIFFYPIYIVGCLWMIPLIRCGSHQSESAKRNGYRCLDHRQVLGVAWEGYHPQYSYFESVVLARKAITAIIVVSAASGLAQSILLICTSVVYMLIVVLSKPFVPMPVKAARNQKLAVNIHNWMEVIWACCVLLTNIFSLVIASIDKSSVLEVLVSVMIGISGVIGMMNVTFPLLIKNEQVKAEDHAVDVGLCTTLNLDICVLQKYKKDRPQLEPYDERSLLGWGDGLWLQSLERLRKETLEESGLVEDKIELAGACTIWIDRLIGRFDARLKLMEVFHPTLGSKRKSVQVFHVPDRLDDISLEDLKFKNQRHSVMGRIGTASITLDLPSSAYVAIHDYIPEEEGYIELKIGDEIDVIERDGDWWRGTVARSGVTGWFPGSYIKKDEVGTRL